MIYILLGLYRLGFLFVSLFSFSLIFLSIILDISKVNIEESKYLNELSVDELVGSLMAHEQRKRLKKKESFKEALQAKVVLEEKTMYVQKGQVCGRGGRSQGQDRGEMGQSSQNL
jgi:hypothetical protein